MPSTVNALEPQPLGSLESVSGILRSIFPDAVWQAPWMAVADGEGWVAEIVIRLGDPIREVGLQVSGRGDTLEPVRAICAATGWQAIDVDAWAFVE
jgi:hypothetical protein